MKALMMRAVAANQGIDANSGARPLSPSSAARGGSGGGHFGGAAVEAQPLGPEHLEAIALARRQARKIMRAAGVAAFSGWSTAVFAFFTLLGGLFSVPALLLGLALAMIAYVELRGSKAVRRFDLTAPQRLGLNQIVLWIVLTIYAAWCIAQAALGPGAYADYIAAGGDLANAIKPIARLQTTVTIAIYSALVVCSAMAQGGAALYYFTRRGPMCEYLARTPQWIVQMLRATAG